MKSNTIWWIALIVVVVLGVYFLVVNRQPATNPEPEFQDVMPGSPDSLKEDSLPVGMPTGGSVVPLPSGDSVAPDELNVDQQPETPEVDTKPLVP